MIPIILRDAAETDFNGILQLNTIEEIQTSPMDLDRLRLLDRMASYHKVATVDHTLAGFLLAMRDGTSYQNDNYQWFASRYTSFLYIDRIVIGTQFSGLKIGRRMYTDLFDHARSLGIGSVVCEYNINPPNVASQGFHQKLGFKEVGTQQIAGGAKLVSLQAVKI